TRTAPAAALHRRTALPLRASPAPPPPHVETCPLCTWAANDQGRTPQRDSGAQGVRRVTRRGSTVPPPPADGGPHGGVPDARYRRRSCSPARGGRRKDAVP